MKKTALLLLMLTALPMTAHAEKLWFEPFDGIGDKAIVAEFDENNLLVGAAFSEVKTEDELCYIETEAKNVRVCFPMSQVIIKEFTEKSDVAVTPEKEPEKESEKTLRYPSARDEAEAYMYVSSVDTVVEGTEIMTKLGLYYQGEETEVLFSEDEVIESTSLANIALYGAPLSSLKEGDVIYCASDLSGDIYSVELIYRPLENDIVKSAEDFGTNFEGLFAMGSAVTERNPSGVAVFGTKNRLERQYAFGLIKDKNNTFMTLCNKLGQEMDITIKHDTVVYVYDMSKRKSKSYIGSVLDIEKSAITGVDTQGNILNWDGDNIHNYALVRMSKGMALDITLYLNYETK